MIFKKSLKYGMAGELVSFNTRQLSDITDKGIALL